MKRIALIIWVFGLAACTRSYSSRQLDAAESVIQTRPDSALRILTQVDTTLLTKPREQARFSLLYSMALDKNYIDTTDLRVIAPAVAYYGRKGNAREKMLAWYYQGRIQFNAKVDADAMNSMLHALSESRRCDAGRYTGLIYTIMADLCGRSFCWNEEKSYLELAQGVFTELGDSITALNIAGRLAYNLFNNDMVLESIHQMDSLEPLYKPFPALYAPLLSARAYALASPEIKDYDSALNDFTSSIALGASLSPKLMAMYGLVLERCGYPEASQEILRRLSEQSEEGKVFSDYRQIEIMMEAGSYEDAYKALRQTSVYQNEEVNRLLSQSLFRTQRDFYSLQQQQLRTQKERQLFLFLTLLLSLLFVGAIVGVLVTIAFKRHREKEAEMDRLADSLRLALGNEQEKSSRQMQENSQLQEQFSGLYAAQIQMLESTYREYEKARRTGAGQKELYDKLLGIIHDIKGNDTNQHLFENLIDQNNGNVMAKLREECPGLPKNDRMLYAYTVSGFDKTTICMLLGNISPDALNMRRSRLRKNLKTLNPPSLAFFLEKIALS